MDTYYITEFPYSGELYHHGIKGQKWGIRRYQNPDGTLTALGKIRYGSGKAIKKIGDSISKSRERHKMYRRSKNPRRMSNAELEAYIKRLNLEISYKEAVEKLNRKPEPKEKSFAKNLLQKSGEKLVLALIDKAIERGKRSQALKKQRLLDEQALYKQRMLDKMEINKQKQKNINTEELTKNLKIKSYEGESAVESMKLKTLKTDAIARSKAEKEAAIAGKRAAESALTFASKAYKDSTYVLTNLAKTNNRTDGGWKPKSVSSKLSSYKDVKDEEKRKKLYGPGGTAYR